MDNIRFEVSESIGVLTINRPKQLNALNRKTLSELNEALLESARRDISCLIITGAGDKAFVGGADISEMADMEREQAQEFSTIGNAVFSNIESMPFPVIAAVNGYALGGGCELAMACDIIMASKTAVFAQPEVGLGIIPGFGGTQRLALRVGAGKARMMIYTGEYIKAEAAFEMGLADMLAEKDELIESAMKLAKKIAAMPASAVSLAKAAIRQYGEKQLEYGLNMESELFGKCFITDAQKDNMRAFLEKRNRK
ncbi:MAG: enoyl-CoA hydratase-related protein [Christensenellales bacterium]|jgi:enoyl-CoA hydratase